jgi:arginase family enzyme
MYNTFFTDLFSEDESDVIVIGVPNGIGGKEYVDSIRKQSWFVEIFDIYKGRNLFDKKIFDAGDLTNYANLEDKLKEIFAKKKVPVIITKGDIASFHACRLMRDVKVVSFDAHTDLLDSYTDAKIESIDGFRNSKENSSTWLRRTEEVVGSDRICIVGLRSIDEDTMDYVKKKNILFITPREIQDNIEEVKDQISIFTKGERIWVNLDVDCFDPSIAPSVDYSEPEGLTFRQFCDIVSAFRGRIAGITLCGGNLMEGNVTEFLSVRSVFELLSKT